MNGDEESPQLAVPAGRRDPVQSPENAAVTLLEYGDYECPYCGEAYPIVKELQKQLGSSLRFVFRNFPLSNLHPHAKLAAEAAEVVGAEGKFWEMHDTPYEHQTALAEVDLVQYARRLGIESGKFRSELRGRAYAERVQEDFPSGVRSRVNGTPTFYINGVRHNGPYELEALLEAIGGVGRQDTPGRPRAGARSTRGRKRSSE
jgi:protein-disulfide isomerase